MLYGQVFLSGPLGNQGAVLKGVDIASELRVSETLRRLKVRLAQRLHEGDTMLLGSKLAHDIGMLAGGHLTVLVPVEVSLTPFGSRPKSMRMRVAGTFESGFYDLDDKWTYVPIETAQRMLSLPDVVNSIELRVDDVYLAPEVAKQADVVAGT